MSVEHGDRIELDELPEFLRIAESELEEIWGYLRQSEDPKAENLLDFESNLEFLYRSIRSGAASIKEPLESLTESVKQTLNLIDATKAASRVFRELNASRAEQQGRESTNLPRRAANLDVLIKRQSALVANIDALREYVSNLARIFDEEATGRSGTSHPGTSVANDNDRRYHHLPWPAAG